MTILLLGRGGQVGAELLTALAPLGRLVAPGRAEADLALPDTLLACVRRAAPRLIVNAAAYTAVDQAEAEPGRAMAINGTAPGVLAEEAARRGIPLIHYSTDYVFDGAKAGPYVEADAPAPLNVYGRTKLAGERAIRDSRAAHLILRTSWVYGARGDNFLRTMLRLFRERETVDVVYDQVGAPTWSRLIAQATAAIVAQCLAPRPVLRWKEAGGLYHLAAAGETSWHGFAGAIAQADPGRAAHRLRALRPVASRDFPTPATRPRNSRLDCTALRERFGVALPPWQQSLPQVLEQLVSPAP